MVERRHGRGVFKHSREYIDYVEQMADDPAYDGMPGVRDSEGRIVWQTSSTQATGFGEYYDARLAWWEARADGLGIPPMNGRLSVAARLIHPTKYRPCLVCGEWFNVGYFYLNAHCATLLNRLTGSTVYQKLMPIDEVLEDLDDAQRDVLAEKFPERQEDFDVHGVSAEAFEASAHKPTSWLTPHHVFRS